jgi:hypothetical protein
MDYTEVQMRVGVGWFQFNCLQIQDLRPVVIAFKHKNTGQMVKADIIFRVFIGLYFIKCEKTIQVFLIQPVQSGEQERLTPPACRAFHLMGEHNPSASASSGLEVDP